MANDGTLIGIHGLAMELGIPAAWLITEADAKRIPHLRIGHRRFFNAQAVRRALAERAAELPSPNNRRVSRAAH